MPSKLNNSILRLLECPVCFNYMSKPIVGCVRGHNICYKCSRHISNCPTCRRPVVATNRNYSLESISELLQYPCVHSDSGCNEFLKHGASEDHRLVCSYRPYHCMLGENLPCQWKGTRFDLAAHALKNHEGKVSISNINSYSWNSNSPLHEINLIKTYDETFLLHRKLNRTKRGSDMMYWAVQYVGRSEDKIQFTYTLHISCDEYEFRSMTFSEHCCDDLRTIDEIIEDDFYVIVPLQQLESFENNTGNVIYQLSIHRV